MSQRYRTIEHVISRSHIRKYSRATASGQDGELDLRIKQYVPLDNPTPIAGDLTIMAADGSDSPKEPYEPLWDDVLQLCDEKDAHVRSIWIADVAHQGGSCIRTKRKLGNDQSWFDHCRDLLHMVNNFRDQLPRLIIGIGHSMGAGQLVLMHPRLLHSLVLLEPVIGKRTKPCQGPRLTRAPTLRKDTALSRADAVHAAEKSLQSWDNRHGFRELPTVAVPENTIPGAQKGDGRTPSIAKANRLPPPDIIGPAGTITTCYRQEPVLATVGPRHVRPSILYVFGFRSLLSCPGRIEDKLTRTEFCARGSGGQKDGRVQAAINPVCAHLVSLVAVAQVAAAVVPWLMKEAAKWRADGRKVATGWAEKSLRKKTTVNDEWFSKVKSLR
ncbi:hypothetical protein BAUCODRAFT_123010 [Baudoinia panamericana UAMH 10762]|uniref:Uncharacterized protein n=1 Tax=Baudoinia panamericana (strain UAMH 10762) TaxID=717646 RepID=M2N9C8_BAUPA|nr:uncharacterized protein BAUCODRAFT_123010 [Baudoinia panamericana UAMH 10762]EMC95709.1 hypothetical protein BAUCODRAFT_123010 [Baudoinia panamericana UAMH 10762]